MFSNRFISKLRFLCYGGYLYTYTFTNTVPIYMLYMFSNLAECFFQNNIFFHPNRQEDANVIFVDWEKGAAGPAYALAAANTQLIGRQLAILITDMVALKGDPARIHMIGFSLGAHVAGFAGKALKLLDIRVGRITGDYILLRIIGSPT